MIARLMILVAQGWQKGPSQVLPPSCRYQPSCSAYAITAIERYGAARGRLAGPQAHLPLPSRGAARATTPYREDREPSERQQEYDPRGGAERARAARLDAGPRTDISRPPTRRAPRSRTASSSRCRSRRRSRRRRRRPRRCRPRRRCSARRPRVRDPNAVARRARSTSRARRSTICSAHAARRRSPRIRRRCGCCRRSARRAPISPQFGWTGQGAPAPGARHGVDRDSASR